MHNFYSRFQRAAEQWPSNIAVELQQQTGNGERFSYAELRQHSASVASWLANSGVETSARCALLAANSPHWVAAYLGILASGRVAVPLDTAFKAEQVAKLLADSGGTVLFTDGKHLELARSATADRGTRLVLLSEVDGSNLPNLSSMFAAGSPGFQPPALSGDDLAAILYTSGTTSDPKGVMLTHGNLIGEVDCVFAVIKAGPSDAILAVLPLFHALAQMANLLLPLTVGARVVYLESLNTRELMRALRERDITLFCCVPQFFYLIHQRILHEVQQKGAAAMMGFRALMSLCRAARKFGLNPGKRLFRQAHEALGTRMRYLITGGSRFDPAIAADLHTLGFEILQAYGLTETSGGATVTPPNHNVLGSVGRPFPGVEIRVTDAQAADGGPAVGEITIRGPIVMKGYFNRPDATAETIRDGWLHTGDLGYLDHGGNLFITGRMKEVIVLSSGKNVYPEEIEAHYQRSPFIKEICIVGVSNPQEPASERLHAVIVPNFEVLRAKKIVNAREVIRFDMDSLSAQLPSTKRVLSYEIWQDDLPRTTTRKLKRFEILKRVAEHRGEAAADDSELKQPARQLSAEDREWLDEPDVAQAIAVVKRSSNLKKDEIHPSDSLELDLGLDSMERVELLVALEQALAAHVPDSVASEVYTVREMVDAVRAGVASGAKRPAFEGWEAILQQPPSTEDVRLLQARQPFSSAFWYVASRWGVLVARDLYRLQATGMEKLPRDGPYIICPNHQSFMDPPIVVGLLPWPIYSRIFSVGTSEIFGTGLARRIAHSFRLFPVDPDANLIPAMRIGAYGLKQGKILMLYPEGERSIDGAPKNFKKGAAILAVHLRVPIYPVALDGFYDIWPRGKALPEMSGQMKIAFGDPVLPPDASIPPEDAYELMISEVRQRIVRMWEELHNSAPQTRAAAAD